MKKIFIFVIIFISIYLISCGRRKNAEEFQEPLTMEELTAITTAEDSNEFGPQIEQTEPQNEANSVASVLESLPPPGPYKPTAFQIQRALNNAGYYVGKVDGKIGPVTKKAIEEFQKARGLKVDGIIGPKTWEELGKYLD